MTCPLCASWAQSDPNCGHYLLNGMHMPALTATRVARENEVLGSGRASRYAIDENGRSEFSRVDHIARTATKALVGGWG